MRNGRQRVAVGAAVAVVLAVTAGCGSGDEAQEDRVAPAGESSSLSPQYGGGYGSDTAGGEDRSGPAGTLALREDAELGKVVTDSEGWTLYRFEEDSAKPPKATCEGDCASAWPPVPADDAKAASGMDAALVGSVERADGSKQLTLGGWPVYRYAKDTKPGDASGHGVGGTWNALAPDGGKAGADAGGGAEAAGSGGSEPAGSAPAGSSPAGSSGDAGESAGKEEGGGADLTAVTDAELGEIVRDAEGRTLYRFDKDTAWPMKSNCNDDCAEVWKPAGAVDLGALEGVDPELVTTFTRDDGSEQLSIDCWPVYTYTGDKAPGDTNGHGVGGTWHAVTPSGTKAAAS
ncbi:hypothetical protein JJV70_16165 [Streptomyces sp. JJ66]|uniref:SCO0930 family lipoprotein n=1 Tax=Streptomyces sp. JJ66 TaxID=2803843 RepID=UPI001C579FAC|nr:SCO0930 family lipoprotein [Streptomyces sp. JJ66]MBW1603611.1 hypothetical protein [Streptomyces sp. JJ66]